MYPLKKPFFGIKFYEHFEPVRKPCEVNKVLPKWKPLKYCKYETFKLKIFENPFAQEPDKNTT